MNRHSVRWVGLMGLVVATQACGGKGRNPLGASELNHAPQITAVILTPPEVTLGGTAVVEVRVVDPDGDAVFCWFSAESGTVSIIDAAQPCRAQYANNGMARESDRITITATDTRNAAVKSEVSVPLKQPTVAAPSPNPNPNPNPNPTPNPNPGPGGPTPANRPPVCSMPPTSPVVGPVSYTASDPDGDPITRCEATGTGTVVVAGCSTNPQQVLVSAGLPGAVIRVTVFDPSEASGSCQSTLQ